MKKKVFFAAALAAVILLAACGEPEEKPAGNYTGTNPTAAPAITSAPTDQPAQPTAEPAASTPTEAPASNTAAPASNTAAPASAPTAAPTAAPVSTATPKPASTPKPVETPKPVQTTGDFAAIAGSWYSSANNRHGNLSLEISSDGSSSLGTLVYDGNGSYHVAGTTMTLSLEKWADGSERLYAYDTYTYEDATYSRSN